MKEQLITFETAKLAKEKGFDDVVTNHLPYMLEGENEGCIGASIYCKVYANCCTQSFLQKWLREVHQIYVQIETDQTTYPKFCYSITRFIGNPNNLSEKEWYWDKLPYNENWSLHRKYEEALEEGLQEALKLI